MKPKNWASSFVYSSQSKFTQAHPHIIQNILLSLNPDDQEKIVPCLEQKMVHSDLEILTITNKLEILKGKRHPLASKKSKKGHIQRGVFAKNLIPKGTILGEYVGEIGLGEAFETEGIYCWQLVINGVLINIDAFPTANEMVFVNDYRNIEERPNCEGIIVVHRGFYHLVYRTTIDINCGEEVLVDYGIQWEKILEKKLRRKGIDHTLSQP